MTWQFFYFMTSWFIRTWRIIGKAGNDEKLSSWTNVSVWGSNNMCIISVQLSFLWGGHYEGRPSGWIWEVSSNTRYPSRAQVQYVRTPVLFVGIRRPSIDTRTMVGNINFWMISSVNNLKPDSFKDYGISSGDSPVVFSILSQVDQQIGIWFNFRNNKLFFMQGLLQEESQQGDNDNQCFGKILILHLSNIYRETNLPMN